MKTLSVHRPECSRRPLPHTVVVQVVQKCTVEKQKRRLQSLQKGFIDRYVNQQLLLLETLRNNIDQNSNFWRLSKYHQCSKTTCS